MYWIESSKSLGTEGVSAINIAETAKWLGKKLGVPENLINENVGIKEIPLSEIITQ
jgi:hypothetical protein